MVAWKTNLSSADSIPESTCSSRPSLSSAGHSGPSALLPSTHRHTQNAEHAFPIKAASVSALHMLVLLDSVTQRSSISL